MSAAAAASFTFANAIALALALRRELFFALRKSGSDRRMVLVTTSPTTYTLNRHPPWLTYSCMTHGGASPCTPPAATVASPSWSWMMATLCESLLPSARMDLARSGSCRPAASTCLLTSSAVPGAHTICRGARTDGPLGVVPSSAAAPLRSKMCLIRSTASSMVSRCVIFCTRDGKSTTRQLLNSRAYFSTRSSHWCLCGALTGTFCSITSYGCPVW